MTTENKLSLALIHLAAVARGEDSNSDTTRDAFAVARNLLPHLEVQFEVSTLPNNELLTATEAADMIEAHSILSAELADAPQPN